MKNIDKKSFENWTLLVETVKNATSVSVLEKKSEKDLRINKLINDYAAFVEYYFPHYAEKGSTAAFQVSAANALKRNPNDRRVVQWARGHAKSTHFCMMIPLFLKAQKKKTINTMVLVGKSLDSSIRLLSDLQAELEANQRYIADFGKQVKFGTWQEGEFTTEDGCLFKALGRGQSPRGLRNQQHRPDYIVLDDIDDDEICQSEKRIEKLYDWVIEALFGAMQMGRGRFIAVGNKISSNSIIAKLEKNKAFKTTKVNALDSKGKPSWHLFTAEEIQKQIDTLGYRASQKELFNNPIVSGSVFSAEWIIYEKPLPLRQYDSLVAYCDPSFKEGATADYKAIILVGKKGTKLQILDAFVRKSSISAMVHFFYELDQKMQKKGAICDYYIEANFIQDLLLEAFREEGEKRGYQIAIRGDYRKKPNKFQRIEAISPLFERGLISVSTAIKEHKDTQNLIDQLLAFGKGSRTHDDAPDALEGAISILYKKHRLLNYTPKFGAQNRKRIY